MPEDSEEEIKIYLRLSGEGAYRFARIKEAMGLKNDTEVIRALITFYWKMHKDELTPKLIYVNMDETGIKIFDKTIPQVVTILVTPDGIKCSYCKTDRCRHISRALEVSDVQKHIRKKRGEGWNLPEV